MNQATWMQQLGPKPKVLVVRLSSIGDIIQCMSVVEGIKHTLPDSTVHWLVRQDMQKILQADPQIDRLIPFDRRLGLWGFVRLAWQLRSERYNLVYDAHYNLRSRLLKAILVPWLLGGLGHQPKLLERHKHRLRRLLFFGLKQRWALPYPFRSIYSFQLPLLKKGFVFPTQSHKQWSFAPEVVQRVDNELLAPILHAQRWVTLVPSAAHAMKRWPLGHFQSLIRLLPEHHWVVLGGPDDHFCNDLQAVAPDRVLNLAGRTSLIESLYVVSRSHFVVSADTGFLHAADLFRRHGVALIGPTAFGFPTFPEMTVLSAQLPCQPCSKDGSGGCHRPVYQQCMVDLTPEQVQAEILKIVH